MRLHAGHEHSQLWPILARFVDYYSLFGVPVRFPRITNPGVRLRFGHQHSRFLSILTRFVDYYSPFLGHKQISILVELQGVLTCRTSTLIDLADSGPFRGLLLTVLGSRRGFHD